MEDAVKSSRELLLERIKFLQDNQRLPTRIPGLNFLMKFANETACQQVNKILDDLNAGKTPEELGLAPKQKKTVKDKY